ncbi:MAG: type II secretion system F family protein [Candidatus Pacearchaeota archaeon]
MTFHIPFTISSLNRLKIKSKRYVKIFSVKRDSKLKDYLAKAEVDITREEYLGIVARSTLMFSVIAYIAFSTAIFILKQGNPFLIPLIPTIAVGMFTSFSQINYPKILADKQQKGIERNLLAAMEDMLIQLSSGVPLFTILVNISASGYGQLSLEFKKAVKKINAGFPQIEVIEELGKKNHSILFRKALWQISNGMKAGSNITEVVRDIIHSLNEEQFLQIQTYGNKLNPLIMFYMLISIILPALAITFLTIISSVVNLPEAITIGMFVGLYIMSILIQIMFLGAIRTAKPSLI